MTLTLDTTVDVSDRGVPNAQPAHIVAPGLAITPSLNTPGRYVLTHVDSGLCVPVGSFCEDHIVQAAAMAAECGIDWTVPSADFDRQAGKRLADEIAAALRSCWTCPNGVTDPEPADAAKREIRIVAGDRFVAAYEGDDLRAVKWHAAGVWYVTDGAAPRTFAEEGPATKAFLAAAEAVPA